jgi:hypothetical protein
VDDLESQRAAREQLGDDAVGAGRGDVNAEGEGLAQPR